MKYTKEDLYEGMQLRCQNDSWAEWWTTGKIYIVFKTMNEDNVKDYGPYYLIADNDKMRGTHTILKGLNKDSGVKFTPIEEEQEVTKFAKITGYAGTGESDKEQGLVIGGIYELVEYDPHGNSYIYLSEKNPRYYVSATQFKLVSKPPFKIGDTVRVLENRWCALDSKGVYYSSGDIDIVSEVELYDEKKVSGRVRLGTHKKANWLTFDCIELVEAKSEEPEPTLSEMKNKLQTKIMLLKQERTHIIDKAERLENQQKLLKEKIDRLEDAEEALELLKYLK